MPQALRLPAELTIYTVGELHPQWLTWLQQQDEAPDSAARALDASAVEQADAAGVQLLLALHSALQQRGCAMQLLEPAQPLLEACAAIGLDDWATALSGPPTTHPTEMAA